MGSQLNSRRMPLQEVGDVVVSAALGHSSYGTIWLRIHSAYRDRLSRPSARRCIVSLDWSHFRDLSPMEFARTYAWYQNVLNLQAAALYSEHGVELLRRLRDGLDWSNAGNWSTETILPVLDSLAPGFRSWAAELERKQPTKE